VSGSEVPAMRPAKPIRPTWATVPALTAAAFSAFAAASSQSMTVFATRSCVGFWLPQAPVDTGFAVLPETSIAVMSSEFAIGVAAPTVACPVTRIGVASGSTAPLLGAVTWHLEGRAARQRCAARRRKCEDRCRQCQRGQDLPPHVRALP